MNEGARLSSYEKLSVGIIGVAVVIAVLFIPMIPTREAYRVTEEYERDAKCEVVSVALEGNESQVVVKNIDAYGGTYLVTHYLYDAGELHKTKTTGEYLAAGESKTVRAEFDTEGLQDVSGGFSLSAPTVIDRRVVTRHRTVYKSLIEILLYG